LAAVIQHIFDDEESPSAVPSLTPLQKIKKEINTYMEYPSLEADADPLAWWKVSKFSLFGKEIPLYMWYKCSIRKNIQQCRAYLKQPTKSFIT